MKERKPQKVCVNCHVPMRRGYEGVMWKYRCPDCGYTIYGGLSEKEEEECRNPK